MHGIARRLKRASKAALLWLFPARLVQKAHLALREPSRRTPSGRTGDPYKDGILSHIDADGYAVIPSYFSRTECEQATREFEAALLSFPEYVHTNEDERIFGAEFVSDIARAFHNDPIWVELAEAYSGEPQQAFCTMANRITYRATTTRGSGGGWHRDGFARELKVLVYLTDTDDGTGPLQLICRSHTTDGILEDIEQGKIGGLQIRLDDEQVDRLLSDAPARRLQLTGAAGTAIVFDTSSIHTGSPLRHGRRLAMTNYVLARRIISEGLVSTYEPIIRHPVAA